MVVPGGRRRERHGGLALSCVGPSGHVVASDVDTRFLRSLESLNLEVWRHDIVNDLFPPLSLTSFTFGFVLKTCPNATPCSSDVGCPERLVNALGCLPQPQPDPFTSPQQVD